jgi:cobalt/nickel transport system ATP-binding protein
MNDPPEELRRRVAEALNTFGLRGLSARPPYALSGGEKKRVALASVLSLMPDVWLLDEPTAGLDPRSVSWLVAFINTQASAGKTIITATHDMDLVAACADRIYVLDEDHRLMAEGTPGQILGDSNLLLKANLAR